jgi:glycosyltransferase involved in cell wall biosynthesis
MNAMFSAIEQQRLSDGIGERTRSEPFSIIIPAYNEERGIEGTLDRLEACLKDAELDFEIIVINDGSTDDTGALLRDRAGIRLIDHAVNCGYGASLKTGVRHAKHELIVIVDADRTYPLEKLPELIALASDADMVVGARIGANTHHSAIRQIPKWFLIRFAQWMARRTIPDLNSGFRVFRKSVVERFLKILPDGFSFTTTITLAMLTNNYVVHYEPIDYHARIGRSKIRPIRDTLGFVQLILRTGMYFAPLRVFLPVAFVFFVGFLITLTLDLISGNLNERTLLLLVAAAQLGMFSLLADMIDKRTG